jgi:UDP-N-acetylmuramoyl-L-alanyl-D-glutamate--2,6-diaminopimelate ligase
MKLRELIPAIGAVEVRAQGDVEISSLVYDAGRAQPGSLFFCVRGQRRDGHDFAPEAVDRGAAALVVERPLDVAVAQAIVPDARAAMAPIAARFHGDPTAKLRVAGITGTNGKTTTAFLLRAILERAGVHAGLLGTVQRIVGGVPSEVVRTTPEAIDLQSDFAAMLDAGDRACVMEVSSHALSLHRADAIHFDVVVFTNLTQDHLDFHADMESYFQAKRTLFVSERGFGPRQAVVNVDDDYGRRLAAEIDCTTFSASGADADLRAVDVAFDRAGSRFRCLAGDREMAVTMPLPGEFNVENALAALAAAGAMGIELEAGAAALADAPSVPGRFEPIDAGQPFAVLVDYAHTPDSLENVLEASRRLTGGRVICVFGCGGDRDRDKRPLMGAIAARLSDRCVITSDNPRSEDPGAIIDEILAGIEAQARESGTVRVESDRRAAIAQAVAEAAPGDIVLIAGKGHEQGQEFEGGRKQPFDDREVAREELARLAPGAKV